MATTPARAAVSEPKPAAKETAKVFEQSEVDIEDTTVAIDVVDRFHQPGKGFTEKTIKLKAIQMSTSFDANGVPGVAGDYLVWWNGHWAVMKDLG